MRTCFRGNGLDMVKWVENFAPIGRERQKIFLRYGLHFIRELMVLILTGHENLRLQGTELDTAKRMKTVIQLHHIEPIMALFNKCIASVERNANPKILFLDASIQMHKIMLKK
jgi:DNA polymerase-3 subunit delta'